jgi:hypothetical protein
LDHLALRAEPVASQVVDTPSKKRTEQRRVVAANFVNGRICQACNNGWMAQLEGEVKPILIRLISDPTQVAALTREERTLVARWTAKTAAVLNKTFSHGNPTNPFARPVPTHHLHAIKSGNLPEEILVVGSGCPSGWPSIFVENASWALMPQNSIPLQQADRTRSYKIGLSFGSLLLGVAFFPNTEYHYAVRHDKHLILWGSVDRVVRLTDEEGLEVPILADLPIMEGFLGNIALISKTMWHLIQDTQRLGLIAKPRGFGMGPKGKNFGR